MTSILLNTDRFIHGADFLPENLTSRSLPGVTVSRNIGYLPTDIANTPTYKSDEMGWIHNPSQRILKRRARRAERQGWLGTMGGSLHEPIGRDSVPDAL